MVDKILCSNCHELNDIQKFCIYCGKKLFDDEQIRQIINPNPYCLNCGRTAKRDQIKCECGYEFADIKCPQCETKNEYTNKFCISCGEKLWKSNVNEYKYSRGIFEYILLKETLPHELRNISVFKRSMNRVSWFDDDTLDYNDKNPNWHLEVNLERLKSKYSDVNENLYEICSRWRIVSPTHCICCLKINSGICSCMTQFLTNEKRIKFLQTEKNYYINPRFDIEELKWTSKNKHETYLDSLAPAIGESQLEYIERLKWDFAANIDRKERIKNVMNNIKNTIKQRNTEPLTFDTNSEGNYCNFNCIHCYEEFFDSEGGIAGNLTSEGYVEYYCNLGHSVVYGRFCEDYE